MVSNTFNTPSFALLNREIVNRKDYPRLAQLFFDKAVTTANNKNFYPAIECASKSLFYARFAGHQLHLNVLALLSWLHHETGHHAQAVNCCRQALQLIREKKLSVESRRKYFVALLHFLQPQQNHVLAQTKLKLAV